MAEENPLAQFRSPTSAAPSGPETEDNPLAQFRSQTGTTAEPTAPDDPEAGIETALKNTLKYAVDVARAVQEEVYLGYGDEAAALVPATIRYILAGADGKKSWGDIYDKQLGLERRRLKEFKKENPTVAGLAGGVGMALTAIPTMGLGMGPTAVRTIARTASTQPLKRPSFGRRMVGGATVGATYGGVYGSGKAEGGLEERLAGADEAGAVGGALGATIPIVGAIARPIISHIRKIHAAKAAGFGEPRGGILGNVPGFRTKVGDSTRAIDPIQEVLESGAGGLPGRVKDPVPESFWADIYPDTRGLLSQSLVNMGRFGHKGRKRLGDRADEAGVKVGQSLDDTLGTPDGLEAVVARMTAERKPKLDRLYAEAEGTPIRYNLPEGENLLKLIRSKRVPRHALTEAQKLLDSRGHVSPQKLFKLDADGNVLSMERVPDVTEVRAIIDGMQQLIEGQKSDIPGKFKPLGSAYISVQKDMKKFLGELVPAYRKASSFAEPTFVAKDAIKIGQDAVGVNVSSSRFKAQVDALKNQHPNLVDMIDPHVRIGMRNRIQDLGERAKTSMAPAPGAAGRVGRFAADDPTTIRLIKNMSSEGLKEKVTTVTGAHEANSLFRTIEKADESILTREAMEKNVREQAKRVLDEAPNSPGLINNVLNTNFFDAAKTIGKGFKGKPSVSAPQRTDVAVADALMQPADRTAMTHVMNLRHKSERGLVGARRAEAVVGGTGLAAAVGNNQDGTMRARAGADYLMGLAFGR